MLPFSVNRISHLPARLKKRGRERLSRRKKRKHPAGTCAQMDVKSFVLLKFNVNSLEGSLATDRCFA